jgi:acetyl-CoA carboxylase biotin carboxyl carrier protein
MSIEEIKSETAGSVWKLLVAVDDVVKSGDVIMLIELMKMEIPIVSPRSGRIVEIFVAETMSVSSNQLVATIAVDEGSGQQ